MADGLLDTSVQMLRMACEFNLHYNIVYAPLIRLNYIMVELNEQERCLSELGIRLKTLRLARNDTMATFAQRLGVSAGTLRAMERGAPTVQIGAWVMALWVLDHLEDLKAVLDQKVSLLEKARAPRPRIRQRASRRT